MPQANAYSGKWFDSFARGIDSAQTRREVDWIQSVAPRDVFPHLLDLCCGLGRHSGLLAERGYIVLGVDRDVGAIKQARQAHPLATFEVGDVREITSDVAASFDLVTILWQSFGFFDAVGNARLLLNLHGLLRPGGVLILDVYDAAFFAKHLQPREFTLAGGERVHEEKSMRAGRLTVTLTYESGGSDGFDWQVFTPDELARFASGCGFVEVTRAAAFDSTKKPAGESPRMQFAFRRE